MNIFYAMCEVIYREIIDFIWGIATDLWTLLTQGPLELLMQFLVSEEERASILKSIEEEKSNGTGQD